MSFVEDNEADELASFVFTLSEKEIKRRRMRETSVSIQNAVVTAHSTVDIPIMQLARETHGKVSHEFPAAMHIKFIHPKCTTLLFSSNAFEVTGTRSLHVAQYVLFMLCMYIRRQTGRICRVFGVRQWNLMATVYTGYTINLKRLHRDALTNGNYHEGGFSTIKYNMKQPHVLVHIFHSGSLVFIGAKRESDIVLAFERLAPILVHFKERDLEVSEMKLDRRGAYMNSLKMHADAELKTDEGDGDGEGDDDDDDDDDEEITRLIRDGRPLPIKRKQSGQQAVNKQPSKSRQKTARTKTRMRAWSSDGMPVEETKRSTSSSSSASLFAASGKPTTKISPFKILTKASRQAIEELEERGVNRNCEGSTVIQLRISAECKERTAKSCQHNVDFRILVNDMTASTTDADWNDMGQLKRSQIKKVISQINAPNAFACGGVKGTARLVVDSKCHHGRARTTTTAAAEVESGDATRVAPQKKKKEKACGFFGDDDDYDDDNEANDEGSESKSTVFVSAQPNCLHLVYEHIHTGEMKKHTATAIPAADIVAQMKRRNEPIPPHLRALVFDMRGTRVGGSSSTTTYDNLSRTRFESLLVQDTDCVHQTWEQSSNGDADSSSSLGTPMNHIQLRNWFSTRRLVPPKHFQRPKRCSFRDDWDAFCNQAGPALYRF